MKCSIYLLALFAAAVAALPATYTVQGTRFSDAAEHTVTRAQPKEVVPVRIGLAQSGLQYGHDVLMDISDPSSPNYGKHLSAQEVTEMFAPSNETITGVYDWLSSSGIDRNRLYLSEARNWVEFDAQVVELEDLLKTEYFVFQNEDGSLYTAAREYSLPVNMTDYIDLVTPTVQIGKQPVDVHRFHQPPPSQPRSQIKARRITGTGNLSEELPNCVNTMTVNCVRALYKFPKGHLNRSSFGVIAYDTSRFNRQDLSTYFGKYTDIPKDTLPVTAPIAGGTSSLYEAGHTPDMEEDFDLELAMTLTYPQQVTNLQVGTVNMNGMGWTNHMNDEISPTSVISISMSNSEVVYMGSDPSMLKRQCEEFKKLALRGVTVFVSTGDIGVGRDGQCCAAPGCSDLKYTNHGGHFIKRFPAVCPYVVAVGMTQMKPGASFEDPEIAGFSDTRFSSGGGFSDHFDMPEWQRGAVNAYLAEHGSRYTAYTFNRNGRAFPDISANGRCHPIVYYENQDTCYSGTSVSAPLVASMFTLINNERIVRGMPVVGYINPILYANPDAFKDVVEGRNPGCNTTGFEAAEGWDPVTGLGTPRFDKLWELFGLGAYRAT